MPELPVVSGLEPQHVSQHIAGSEAAGKFPFVGNFSHRRTPAVQERPGGGRQVLEVVLDARDSSAVLHHFHAMAETRHHVVVVAAPEHRERPQVIVTRQPGVQHRQADVPVHVPGIVIGIVLDAARTLAHVLNVSAVGIAEQVVRQLLALGRRQVVPRPIQGRRAAHAGLDVRVEVLQQEVMVDSGPQQLADLGQQRRVAGDPLHQCRSHQLRSPISDLGIIGQAAGRLLKPFEAFAVALDARLDRGPGVGVEEQARVIGPDPGRNVQRFQERPCLESQQPVQVGNGEQFRQDGACCCVFLVLGVSAGDGQLHGFLPRRPRPQFSGLGEFRPGLNAAVLQQPRLTGTQRGLRLLFGPCARQGQHRAALLPDRRRVGRREILDVQKRAFRDGQPGFGLFHVRGGQPDRPLEVAPRGGKVRGDRPVRGPVSAPAGLHGFPERERPLLHLLWAGDRKQELPIAENCHGEDMLALGQLDAKHMVPARDRRGSVAGMAVAERVVDRLAVHPPVHPPVGPGADLDRGVGRRGEGRQEVRARAVASTAELLTQIQYGFLQAELPALVFLPADHQLLGNGLQRLAGQQVRFPRAAVQAGASRLGGDRPENRPLLRPDDFRLRRERQGRRGHQDTRQRDLQKALFHARCSP